MARFQMVSARARVCRAARIYRGRNRLDGDGSRTPAVDYFRRHANGGRRHADARTRRAVRNFYAVVYFSRNHYSLVIIKTSCGKPEIVPGFKSDSSFNLEPINMNLETIIA